MNVSATLQQAIQFHQKGQLDAAQALYEKVLKADKNQADAHNLLGAIHVAKKQFKLAEKHLLKAAKLSPSYAPIHYNLGKCYVDAQQPQKAYMPLKKAVQLDGNYIDAIFVLGNVEVQLGKLEKAIPLYKQLLTVVPNHLEGLNNLGNALHELKRDIEALPYFNKAIELAPKYQPAYLGKATALTKLDRHDEALEVLNQAEQIAPHARIAKMKASNFQQSGNMQAAKEAYLETISLDPSLGSAYRGYSEVTKVKSDEEVAVVQAGFDHDMLDEEKKHLYFAWGKVQDGLENYAEAIDAYNKANALHRKSYQYKLAEDQRLFAAIKKAYTQQWVENLEAIAATGKQVIFILGMPRSGTTLVEQIISSHSTVTGAGELEYVGENAKTYKDGAVKFHQRFPNMGEEAWLDMANSYLADIEKLSDDMPIVTDKMPHNFLYMGIIAALLPNAKIVHCKRNPVANCLSIYKQFFTAKNSHRYAYNQTELAQYHNLYEDLMDHWRAVMPDRFYEIKYEELTSNQEEETRKLIEYCGLEWEDACMDFHKTKRKVKTASAFQVRQPMSTKSVGLWKKYGDGLKPLVDNLYMPPEYRD